MTEAGIVEKIKAYLKTVPGCFFYKNHGGAYGTAGLPDLVICFKGRFAALEVKTATGKPTVLQEITLDRIRKAGGIAEIVRSVGEVKRIIAEIPEIRTETGQGGAKRVCPE
jgi:hypothetical protein